MKEAANYKIISRLTLSLTILTFSLFSTSSITQKNIDWEILSDVTFENKFDEETSMYWLIPDFGKNVLTYKSKQVILEGFVIPIDLEEGLYVLSRFPYSSCFFCGAAGPASIVEVLFKEKVNALPLDLQAKIQGQLILNDLDFDHFNYILKEAKIVERK